MDKMTITEALAELTLIKKKILKHEANIKGNLIRAEHNPDLHAVSGGSLVFNEREEQSIRDLWARYAKIRAAIHGANLTTELTINASTRSVYEWLVWRKDVAKPSAEFYTYCYTNTKRHLDEVAKNPQAYKDANGNACFVKLVPNIPYEYYLVSAAKIDGALGILDGKLSLINATTLVEV